MGLTMNIIRKLSFTVFRKFFHISSLLQTYSNTNLKITLNATKLTSILLTRSHSAQLHDNLLHVLLIKQVENFPTTEKIVDILPNFFFQRGLIYHCKNHRMSSHTGLKKSLKEEEDLMRLFL